MKEKRAEICVAKVRRSKCKASRNVCLAEIRVVFQGGDKDAEREQRPL